VSRDDRSYVLFLAAIAGVVSTITSLGAAQHIHWFAVVTLALVLGPLLGILQLYVNGVLLAWAGRLLGGHADQRSMRTATAWASAPQIIALPLIIGSIIAFGQAFLRSYGDSGSDQDPVFLAIQVFLFFLFVWSLVLAVRAIGAVQNFGVVRAIINALSPLAVLLAAAFLIRAFLFQPFVIPAGSMRPTVLPGDNVFANKTSYGYSQYSFPIGPSFSGRIWPAEPARGDVVVFRLTGPRTDYIKRIVGLPDDQVQMKSGVLYINGAPVPKDYVDDVSDTECDASRSHCLQIKYRRYREALPGGATYMVLDLEPNGDYDNTPAFQVPAGHYFMMGDNRDNSNDSRSAIGFVPYENLIGRLSTIYFSAEELGDKQSKWDAFDNIRWNRIFQVPH